MFAALGLIVSGGLASVLLVGLLEWARKMPDGVSRGAGVVLYLIAKALGSECLFRAGSGFPV